MKTHLFSLFLFVVVNTSFSQVFKYERSDARIALVTKEQLSEAKKISDFLPDYPHDYYAKMIDYVSVDYIYSVQGKTLRSNHTNDLFSEEQKRELNLADAGSDVLIQIKFSYKDPADDMRGSNSKIKEMDYKFMLTPHMEAAFPGGYPNLTDYLNEHVFKPAVLIPTVDKILNVVVSFSIDETGKMIETNVSGSTSNLTIDQLILKALDAMPKWSPAENINGEKVKQVFKLYFKFNSGGC